jgi:hypothetical protein
MNSAPDKYFTVSIMPSGSIATCAPAEPASTVMKLMIHRTMVTFLKSVASLSDILFPASLRSAYFWHRVDLKDNPSFVLPPH